MEKIPRKVEITHIINPSRFYCRDLSLINEEAENTKNIEESLMELAESRDKNMSKYFELNKGELVAFFCDVNRKWIRCEVDECKTYSGILTLILWAIDYGFPFYTKNFKKIFPLHGRFRYPCSKIFVAGLEVVPAKPYFDSVKCKEIIQFNDEWMDHAVEIFKTNLSTVSEVFFLSSKKFSHTNVSIGDLLVSEKISIDYGMSSKLVKDHLAVYVAPDYFQIYYEKLYTNHIERWNDNRRSGGVLKLPEGIAAPLIVKKLSDIEDIEESSVLGAVNNSINQRIMQWMDASDTPKNFESISCSRTTSISSFQQSNSNKMSASEILESFEMDMEEENTSKNRTLTSPIFMPAGAMMSIKQKNITTDHSKGSSTLQDEQFVSVSEVGSHAANDEKEEDPWN
ncbi:CLUMA_CG014337, isoform A [Clunio marinus]|uniref:CLUMA_CG014337, isoform A n=1 Tax=Clunio marinus TaxID=568069 RepID=A0A1J1IN41_9DIPT|nr:CLUMA_CG014337, isoform A [Clunio marinus]